MPRLFNRFAQLGLGLVVFAAAQLASELAASDDHHGVLLVTHILDGTVAWVDTDSGETLSVCGLAPGPHEIALSPDGSTAVVPLYAGQPAGGNVLYVLDVAQAVITRVIPLGRETHDPATDGILREPIRRPHGVTFMPDGKRVLVTAETDRALLVVNISTGRVEQFIKTGQDLSHMVVLARDGQHALVANKTSGSVSVIDLEKGRLVKNVLTGSGAQGMDVHPLTGEIWVTNINVNTISVLDADSFEEVAEFECGVYPVRVKFTPDGSKAIVTNYQPGTVSVVDVESRKLLKEINLSPVDPDSARPTRRGPSFLRSPLPVGLLIEPCGRFAYVSSTRRDMVAVINLESFEVVRELTTGREPDGLAWVADWQRE